MFKEADGYSSRKRYQTHPMKTVIAMLLGNPETGKHGPYNELKVSDSTTHFGHVKAGIKGI